MQFETENLLSDAAMYGALGVGFSQTEWYSIMLTVKKLGEDPVKELKTVRTLHTPFMHHLQAVVDLDRIFV